MSIVCPTCPLDFHHFPSVILVPLSPLHKGTIVSALSPLLFEVLCVTCLHVVLGNYQRRSTNFLLPLSRHIVAEVIHYTRMPSTLQTSLTVLRVHSHLHRPSTFFGSMVSFSPSTTMPRYLTWVCSKTHFEGQRKNDSISSMSSTSCTICSWSSSSPGPMAISRSSTYSQKYNQYLVLRCQKIHPSICMKVARELVRPKYMTVGWNRPKGVLNAAIH